MRPERIGYGYTVEWTTVTFDTEEQEWRQSAKESTEGQKSNTRAVRQSLNQFTSKFVRKMPRFEVDREPINIFAVNDQYLFKHYFEEDDAFAVLRPYYNEDDYRFEVPQDAFEDVQEDLKAHFYEPVIIRDLEPFCVVYPKYTDHPSVLFKASVLQRSHGETHIFLMKDQLSAEQAIDRGATALADVDIDGTIA